MQIMRWALARNIFVLSDEIYDQLVFPPAKMTSAITWFEHCPELVAVLNGLSKSYAMTGWRVGFLAAHPDLIKKISSMQGHSTSSICSVSQKAALAALEGPVECVGEMRAAFLRRRDLALDIIKAWPWAVCPKPDGAFYLFVDVHQCYGGQVRNSTELCTYLLDKAHVALVPARPSATTTVSASPTRWRTTCWPTPFPAWARCWANWPMRPGAEPDNPDAAGYGRITDHGKPRARAALKKTYKKY